MSLGFRDLGLGVRLGFGLSGLGTAFRDLGLGFIPQGFWVPQPTKRGLSHVCNMTLRGPSIEGLGLLQRSYSFVIQNKSSIDQVFA